MGNRNQEAAQLPKVKSGKSAEKLKMESGSSHF